ncbi:DUF2790 domain-containing protein [Pseudomonas fluorescens]|uniref:DUF2790 domain-containing protein n=1 Tax=Pseudomonas fluorescens TaxID=294 RepID=UPI00123EFA65|nr:DUF2790 domain-containing protein [Pseudomonas fluorescens]VVN43610.1 hypothetical protein PS676_05546 [Pseudomonas fluorescens]
MKKIWFIGLPLVVSLSAYALEPTFSKGAVDYKYGMKLDIAKIVDITTPGDVCGPTPVEMTYIDSKGTTRVLHYSVIGTGCTN